MSTPFNFSAHPFETLNNYQRTQLERVLDIVYFAKDQIILTPSHQAEYLYVVLKGCVKVNYGTDDFSYLNEDDVFDHKAILSGRMSTLHLAEEDTLLWQIPRAWVLNIIEENALFAAYFYEDIAKRLSSLAHKPYQQETPSLFLIRVEQVNHQEAVILDESATIMDAAIAMKEYKTTSVLVKNGSQLGIFTQSDLRNTVIDLYNPHLEPVKYHAHSPIISIQYDASIHQAMLLLMTHKVQRLLILNGESIVGLLEQVDLLSTLANNPHSVMGELERARSVETVAKINQRSLAMIGTWHASGMKITLLAELYQKLHYALLARLFELIFPKDLQAKLCLLAMGSEGRGEQLLATDQDNALIFSDDINESDIAPYCATFTQAMIDCGYPACKGNIMVSNPHWRGYVSAFKQKINQWTTSPNPNDLMELAIFLDAYAVAGNSALFDEVQIHLHTWLNQNPAMIRQFARPLTFFDLPLGLFSRLVANSGREHDQLDLKKGGIFPITHGIRTLALEQNIRATNTYTRIHLLSQTSAISEQLANDCQEALAFLQGLQLKYGLDKLARKQTLDHLIHPQELTTLEKNLLKDALAVVKQFKTALVHRFKLD